MQPEPSGAVPTPADPITARSAEERFRARFVNALRGDSAAATTAAPLTGFVCPLSHVPLVAVPLAEAQARVGAPLAPAPRTGPAVPVGPTPTVLLREDLAGAYPVLPDGIPVLVGPEILVPPGSPLEFDLSDPVYLEAYQEMGHYDAQAAEYGERISAGELPPGIAALVAMPPDERVRSFPDAWELWVDAQYDSVAQQDCYVAMGPLTGRVIAQLGGSGLNAVKFLMAGAERAYLVTPMPGELRYGRALAEACGVGDRLVPVAALGEQLPFPDRTFWTVYAPGCLHHMEMAVAGPEIYRTLQAPGMLVAAEPWRAALYAIGTKIFGRREAGAFCKPMTDERVAPMRSAFDEVVVDHHAALTRYPTLALAQFKLFLPIRFLYQLFRLDDRLTRRIPWLRRQGPSVTVIARRTAA